MSTAKRTARSRSRSDATDTPSTKGSKAAEDSDTPLSTQASSSFALEFLSDSQLPSGQELARLNGLIHGDVKADVSGGTIEREDVTSILQILDERCQFLDAVPHGRSLRADKQALDHFVRIAQAAFQQEDYSQLMLIKGLRRSPEAVVESSSSGSLGRVPNHDATVEGWKAPFLGSADQTLVKNIRKMYENAIKRPPGCEHEHKYVAHASILQSSGSGKSRLVDRVAETIFTIPFNIREKSNTASGAWPPADHAIRDLLAGWAAKGGERRLRARYLAFFAAVFDEVRKEVGRCIPQGLTSEVNIASAWREHLADEGFKQHRNTLYSRVVNSSVVQEANAVRKIKPKKMESFLTTAKDALKQLLHAVCVHHVRCMSHADDGKTSPINKIHVLIYFDEAHTLAARQGLPESLPGSKGKTALDVLFSVLNDFCDLGVFTIFLSTQSHLESLAPPASLARSARYRSSMPYMHAPITETPFDSCFGDHPVIPSRLCAGDVSNIEFMACFGRPLWRSQLLPFANEALQRMWGAAPDSSSPATPLSAEHKSRRCQELVALAGSRLVCQPNLHRHRSDFCQAAQTAVLDVRIVLSFEPRHAGAHHHQMELVASHLRTVYSVPQARERTRSGYSSEPILAEAAARQLDYWRKLETTRLGRPMEPAALILQANLDHDLLDRGETGEAVGRLLLILARDHAARALRTSALLFSRAVPMDTFIKALFTPAIAQQVLESKPENLLQSNGMTFEKAFEGAVLNFTHFAKWADDSALSPDAAVGCFVRSMAVICGTNSPAVDAFIPVLLDPSARLCPEVMTGILVQFKRRKAKGAKGAYAYAIDEKDVGLFDSESPLMDGQTASRSTRPYVTLVMELGVPESPSSHAGAAPVDATRSSKVPIPVVVGHPPERASDRLANAGTVQPERDPGTVPRKQHPRYSIIVYGCSSSAYQVIGEDDFLIYKQILRKSDGLLLQEHPRQDTRSLNVVRRLKPAFSVEDASWEWATDRRTDMQPESSDEDEDGDKDTDGMES